MMSKDWYPPFSMWRIFFILSADAFSYHYATAYLLYHKTFSQHTQLRIPNCTDFCTIMLR